MDKFSAKKTIVLTGGGTLGSVVPLLALADELAETYQLIFVGTKNGVEAAYVSEAGLPLATISSGKWRRYWSWQNLLTPWLLIIGWAQSLSLLRKIKPALVITTGSFVSVPLVMAAWCCRVPILVHQLDYAPGLANKLMSPLAKRVTVSFKKSVKDYARKAIWVGLPVRRKLLTETGGRAEACKQFKLKNQEPIILVLGGGTGAGQLNRLITDNLHNLTQICQIIHLTGPGKEIKVSGSAAYHQFAALNQKELALAYQAADLVVSRAGMGTLSELAFLSKPAIVIPMPDSHQEANAKVLSEAQAAIVLNQKKLTSLELYRQIKDLLADQAKADELGANLHQVIKTDANDSLIKIVKEIAN